ncbi:MAG TPA: sigma-70 family RNA polymerase sigma factor [Opitutaceae bacterium]|nr:sigma-70 family RNA polymerase sigma factor [Opitutaceae bacterium]
MTPTSPAADVPETGVRGPTAFATTHWSLIVRAAETGTPEGRAALEELCRIYWYPLYGFARRRGLAPADAEDLTQSFLADLLARGAVAQADPARGRFRTFLLASFENFHSHERRRADRLKRGGGCEFVSLEEAEKRFQEEPVSPDSPEKMFDQKWAMSLLDQAIAAVDREYAANGKGPLFDALKAVLWGAYGAASYAEIARQLGSTEGAIKVAAHRLRRRFGEALRSEVAKTVLDPADLEDEMRHLLAAVSL